MVASSISSKKGFSSSFGDLGNGKGTGTTKARDVVESFGGTDRKAISGHTDYLLHGSRDVKGNKTVMILWTCDEENKRPVYDSDKGDKKPAAKRQKTDALLEGISASAIALLKGEKAWGEGAVSNALK
ncbi:predicted protein [Chaetoceros tenuissimus]|uniref:Uncharacterized protein n=1 Tax=Chaetoceros tenuissimus TaxID=426638 RepID=A0AAD3HD43_9STRA|nr:predicted protein [Chaetoceros tenuissimus]